MKPVFGGFKTRLKFIKFGHRAFKFQVAMFKSFLLPNHLHDILVNLSIMYYSDPYISILIFNCLFIHVKMSYILTIGYSYNHILLFKFLCDNTVDVERPVKLNLNSAHFADFLTWSILAFLA